MSATDNHADIFITADGTVELTVQRDGDTVWLSQAQMAELFAKDVRTINEHISNIFVEEELSKDEATIRNFRIVRQEGKRQVQRHIEHYNLDVIISVGYRVKSQRGVQFRQWATRTLKQHLIEGYTLQQNRLLQRGIAYQDILDLLSQTLKRQALINEQGSAVMHVVQDYARSWQLLQHYDEQNLPDNTAQQHSRYPLSLAAATNGIANLKASLIAKGEASDLFAQPRGDGLASILATIEQGFGDTLFYPNIASRAAHLLFYFMIKNHPLSDGNKRSGSFLFLYYLTINEHLLAKPVAQLINDNTLVALALLVAESDPAQKALIISLIQHFILLKTETPT